MDRTLLGSFGAKVRGGTITVVSGANVGATLTVGAEPQVVGRHPGCALVLDDKKVSATHIEVVASEWGVRVRDLGSTNGTLLGGHRIESVVLASADRVTCGQTVLECRPGKAETVPLSKSERFGPLVGAAANMRALFAQLAKLAPTPLSVLIQGETGTGKELVAQALHEASDRAKRPFVVIDCGSIPPQLAESTLFGHERGSFTGAVEKRTSPFVDAAGGTVFLDELGELPIDIQPKLLRVLEARQVQAVGSKSVVPIDVRVVAATRRDLLQEINKGTFRDDLYFRIAQARVVVPPLRDRADDIPVLVRHMMEAAGKADAFRRVPSSSLDQLVTHYWQGNVRELKNVVSVALAYDDGSRIDVAEHLVAIPRTPVNGSPAHHSGARPPYTISLEEHDRAYFTALYEQTHGNLAEITRRAGLDRVTVRKRLRLLRIGKYGDPTSEPT